MWNEEDGSICGYMCKIDWDHELGNAAGGSTVYSSEEELRRCHDCVDECGIVKVKVELLEIIKETHIDY